MTTNHANYRKLNDRSMNSSTYHKKDDTNTSASLKRETANEAMAASECEELGHVIEDCSSAGPDSGNMDHRCVRCGRYWSVPLY